MRLSKSILLRTSQVLLALLFITAAFYFFIGPREIELLLSISALELLVTVLLALIIYSLSGFELRLILQRQGFSPLSWVEVVVLPIVMNLWSFIIPIQGALIYSSLYLKFAHGVRVSSGIAANLFSYLVSVVLTGVIGLLYSIYFGYPISFMFVAVLLILVPIGLPVSQALLKAGVNLSADGFKPISGWLETVLVELMSMVESLLKLMRQKQTVALVIGMNLLHTLLSLIWNMWIAYSLAISASVMALLLFTLLVRLSLILKLTPGNIGLQELVSGGVFLLLGFDPADGVLISLVTRVATLLLMATVGVAATLYNLRYVTTKQLFSSS